MSRITFDYADPQRSGTDAPARGSLTAALARRETVGGRFRTQRPFLIELVDGVATVELSDTGPDQYWVVREESGISKSRIWYKAVSGDAAFTDLVDVDPTTALPDPGTPIADAYLEAVQAAGVQAQTSRDAAVEAKGIAVESATSAAADAQSASDDAASAEAAKELAVTSADAAGHSEVNAAVAASNALQSATNAEASSVSAGGHDTAAGTSALTATEALSAVQALLDSFAVDFSLKLDTAEKGAPSGVASLDDGGKVPWSQLPSTLLKYRGVYNATTGLPALTDGTGDTGDTWKVAGSGSRDFGSGPVDLNAGDLLLYNGAVWEKVDTTDAVASVNGKTGLVVLAKADVGLSHVDDTADLDKPISNATQTALNNTIVGVTITGRSLMFTTLAGGSISAGVVVPNITVITATGAAGSSVVITTSGTATDPIWNVTIPRGDKGDPGDLTAASSGSWSGAISLTTVVTPASLTRTLSGNITGITLSSPPTYQAFTITLTLKQAATGGPYTVAWPAGVKWAGDAPAPTMPTAANAELIVHLFWTGAAWRGMVAGVFFP